MHSPNGPGRLRPVRRSWSVPSGSWATWPQTSSASRVTLSSKSDSSRSHPEMVYVALGSNLGDRQAHLQAARSALASLPDTTLVAASQIEETEPLGGKQQPA